MKPKIIEKRLGGDDNSTRFRRTNMIGVKWDIYDVR